VLEIFKSICDDLIEIALGKINHPILLRRCFDKRVSGTDISG
jgi:hypothetical protein